MLMLSFMMDYARDLLCWFHISKNIVARYFDFTIFFDFLSGEEQVCWEPKRFPT